VQFFPPKSSAPETRDYKLQIEFGDTADPSVVVGQGVTATRTGTGAYLLTFGENPGQFMGWSTALATETPGNVAGFSVERGPYSAATTFTLSFIVYDRSGSATDLDEGDFLDATISFAATSVELGG